MLARTELCGDKTGASGGNVRSTGTGWEFGAGAHQVYERGLGPLQNWGVQGATKHPTYVR